jgi:hypothetical protein
MCDARYGARLTRPPGVATDSSRDDSPHLNHRNVMQGKNSRSSVACTAWLVAATLAPFGAVFARPMAIIGAVFVLFALLIAGVEFHPSR